MRAELARGLIAGSLLVLAVSAIAQPPGASTASGSLIQPDTYRSLVADRRAHRIGDTLTVIVLETASASASANTDGSNSVQLAAHAQTPLRTYPYALGLSGSDQGQGVTSRTGALNAQLTVRVIDVESDGLLRVRGEQTVVVNGEKQRIALTGLVREEDILASNIIPSNRISDAQIEFTGHGDVSEAQRRSVIYRFMKWLRLL